MGRWRRVELTLKNKFDSSVASLSSNATLVFFRTGHRLLNTAQATAIPDVVPGEVRAKPHHAQITTGRQNL